MIIKPLVTLMFGKKWRGMENIPSDGGIIVAANHASLLDPLTAAHFLYNANRPPRILAKASLWRVPFVGWVLRRTQMIPVLRGSAEASQSLEIAKERLDAGFCIAVFPEGTLTRDPEGWPMQARTGVARLALASQRPVIPLAQWGVTDVLPRGGKFPSFSRGKPFSCVPGNRWICRTCMTGPQILTRCVKQLTALCVQSRK